MAFPAQQFSASFGATGSSPVPILKWLMGSGDYGGSGLTDTSGNGYTGALVNNPTWSTSSPPGGAYSYLEFDGSSQYAKTTGSINYGSNQIITIDFYAKCASWSGISDCYICAQNGSSNAGVFLIESFAGHWALDQYDANGFVKQYRGSAPTDANWHHIQAVFNNSGATSSGGVVSGGMGLYVDSGPSVISPYTGSWATPCSFATGQFGMAGSNASEFFPGNIALFQIFAGDTHTL